MSYNAKVRERGGEDHPVEAYRRMPDHRAVALGLWIRLALSPRKTVRRGVTSYGLKHQAEREIGSYIANDQFKGAMLAQGYEPADGFDLNWEFGIRPREGRRLDTESGLGLDRYRLDPSLVVLFDMVASWSRMNAEFEDRNRRAFRGDAPLASGPIARETDAQAFGRAERIFPGLIPGRVLSAVREGDRFEAEAQRTFNTRLAQFYCPQVADDWVGRRRNASGVRPGRRVG